MSEEMVINIEGTNIVVKGTEKLEMVKIGIGIPIGKSVDSEFLKMLLARIKEWMNVYKTTVITETIIPVDLARNIIVKIARKENCDYLFFLDSDILVEQGQLEKLLSQNKDVVTGIYYQKKPPYSPLPRKKVAKGIYLPIEMNENDLIEIDGTGMGCFLIKMDVFNRIPYPWFEFKYYQKDEKWYQISEDLYFCQKLQNAGIKILCDSSVQCAHIGIPLNTELSQKYKEFRINHLRENYKTIEELFEFTGISPEEIYYIWKIAPELVANEYREFLKQNHRDPKDFYKTNKNYIFDLTGWHITKRRFFDFELAKSIKEKYPFAKKILDFGSGCGQNAIELAEAGYDVAMADYYGYTSQFAIFRTKKRGLDIKFYDIEKPIEDKFDVILAFDVFEHVPDNEFEDVIERLKSLRCSGGKIMTTVSFGTQNGLHPMHYESSPEKLELIQKLESEQE